MRSMPLVPALVASHHASAPMPFGATTPMPVSSARRSREGRVVSSATRSPPGRRSGHADTSRSSSGSEKIIADWKPPKPLPVESAVLIGFCRATPGV